MSASKPRTIVLARRIAELAIRSEWRLGRRVTEMELAQAMGVSRTPIRRAMGVLADEGALKPHESRGFFLSKDGQALAQIHLDATPAAGDRLYALILKDRIAEALPIVVTYMMLARRYRTSRSVLEQALARLEADGLLLRGSGRAWRFVETMNDINSITASYDVRLILEPAALTLWPSRFDAQRLQPLRKRHRQMLTAIMAATSTRSSKRKVLLPRSLPVGLDAEFHIALSELSGNPFIVATIRHHVELRRLLEHNASADPWHVATWCREHLRVLDALVAGRRDVAANILRRHLERARGDALASLLRAKRRVRPRSGKQ